MLRKLKCQRCGKEFHANYPRKNCFECVPEHKTLYCDTCGRRLGYRNFARPDDERVLCSFCASENSKARKAIRERSNRGTRRVKCGMCGQRFEKLNSFGYCERCTKEIQKVIS